MKWLAVLADAGVEVALSTTGGLKFRPLSGAINDELANAIRENKAAIIAELSVSLDYWTARARAAGSIADVQNILDEFRPLPWSDRQRSEMAQACEKRRQALYQPQTFSSSGDDPLCPVTILF